LTNTGIAVLVNGAPAALRSVGHGSRNGRDYSHRSDRIVSQCRAVMDCLCDKQRNIIPGFVTFDLAVIEGPAYGENLPSNHDRAGLWWGLFSALRARQIATAVVPPATAKLWATGRGNARKGEMLTTARTWWPGVKIGDHDQADALALALIGAFKLGDPMPFEVKDRHHAGLEKVAWPEPLIGGERTTQ
jgi:Holliday junction resolvasome RuvABC endonuclease subunit